MALDASPSTRSEPIVFTPNRDRELMESLTKLAKSVTPQKRSADFYSSSPALTHSGSSDFGSSPLTQSRCGISKFQERLRRTTCSSIPSSPPDAFDSEMYDREHEPQTPSKLRSHPSNELLTPYCDTESDVHLKSSGSTDAASAVASGLEHRLSKLSTRSTPAKRVRYDNTVHIMDQGSFSSAEDPFTGQSSPNHTPQTSSFDTSLPDVDVDTDSNGAATSGELDGSITANNAQSILLPQACVFAANLPRSESDEAILAALEKTFSRFGQCWVKVLRTNNDHMPYAFVQYVASEQAHVAVEKGRGADILGRPCRTETARAHRAVYVTRRDGRRPSEAEITTLLAPFGEIEAVVFPTETEIHVHDLQPGGWARFRIFGECKEAINQLQHSNVYYVRQAKQLTPKDIRFLNDGDHRGHRYNFSKSHNVWIGGLPATTTESVIRERFRHHGRIKHIDLRTETRASGSNVEAVIMYGGWRDAERAVNSEDDLVTMRNGRKRRVAVDYAVDQTQRSGFGNMAAQQFHGYGRGSDFGQLMPMGHPAMMQSPMMGQWMPDTPRADMIWQGGFGAMQAMHAPVNNSGGTVAGPFYGIPMQYFPGPAFATFDANTFNGGAAFGGPSAKLQRTQHSTV